MRQTRQVHATQDRIARLGKRVQEHKYDHGHCLIISGPSPATGAARLAAMGALRVGAGLVTLGAKGDAVRDIAAHVTAIMLREMPDASALERFLRLERRVTSLCIGPGLGRDSWAEEMVAAALDSKRACVLDADAITLLAERQTLRDSLHMRCLLTPHAGEFRRAFPDFSVADVMDLATKAGATRQASADIRCAVAYKGAQTVLADPAGETYVSDLTGEAAVPWLATAGSGDVFAGIAAGLLARGWSPFEGGATAALIHGEAARLCGPGMIAEDLPPAIARVFAKWGV